MPTFSGQLQEVMVVGGYVCFWVGPTRASATFFGFILNGSVAQGANNSAGAAFLIAAGHTSKSIRVTTDASGLVTELSIGRINVFISSVSDPNPYARRNHNHDGRYALINHNHNDLYAPINHNHDDRYSLRGHDHDGRYAFAVHNHDTLYSALGHNHDHNLLNSRLQKEHTLTLTTNIVRGVPLGTPLRVLQLADFAEVDAELRDGLFRVTGNAAPTAAQLRQAYIDRAATTNIEAWVADPAGNVLRGLSGTMSRDTVAPDLRWNLRLYTLTDAEYTRPGAGSTDLMHLRVTTQLKSATM